MNKLIVAGIDTDVGKTVTAAILTQLLQADYWKPIQCGDECSSDTTLMKQLTCPTPCQIHPPAYSFKAPLSPHHAARLENTSIDIGRIIPPKTRCPLVIEGAGGIFTPLTLSHSLLDLFATWNAYWVLVSRHYLGSINHTLLTIEALQQRKLPLLGIIFNGDNRESEEAILAFSKLPILGRLLPEEKITPETIRKYTKQWKIPLFL